MEDASGDMRTPTGIAGSASGPEQASPASDGSSSALRRLLTPRWIAFTAIMLAAVAACLLLARWQYVRFESVSGTWQNLGYTLQWPFFAAFAVYVWWRLLRDAGQPSEQTVRPSAEVPADRTGRPPATGQPADGTPRPDGTKVSASVEAQPSAARLDPSRAAAAGTRPQAGSAIIAGQRVPDDEDDAELAAYNEYLAALNRRSPG